MSPRRLPSRTRARRLLVTRAAVAVVTLAAVAVPATASAATVTDERGVLTFRAGPGERNHIGIQEGGEPGLITLYQNGATLVGPFPAGCEYTEGYGGASFVTCTMPAAGVRLELGDGDDWGYVSLGVDPGLRVAMAGGPGNDRIETHEGHDELDGGPGDDQLRSGPGDDLLTGGEGNDELDGYEGADRLAGGEGDDLLYPDHYERASPDVVDGGPGIDRIEADWGTRLTGDPEPPVSITLGGGADDGRPAEGDDIQGVERIILSKGGRVVGTDASEYVKLHQVAEPGVLIGAGGDDELRGGDGADAIDGGPGADLLDGGFGDDAIIGGPGRDTVSADLAGGDCGPLWCKYPFGNDTVDVRDGEADSVSCGVGTDRVLADAQDTVAPDCEHVQRQAAAVGSAARPRAVVSPVRLRAALRTGLRVRVTGMRAGAVRARVLYRGRLVGSGSGRVSAAGRGTVLVRFTPAGRRALAKVSKARLVLAAGTTRQTLMLRR